MPQLFIHHSTTSSLVSIICIENELKFSKSYRLVDLALLGAQVLAGISETGIPAPGGRTVHPSEAQLRGFLTIYGTMLSDHNSKALFQVNADHVVANRTCSKDQKFSLGVSLLAAQVLAGLGTNGVNLGKRDLTEAEMRGFLDSLTDAFSSVFTNVLQQPLENALSSNIL